MGGIEVKQLLGKAEAILVEYEPVQDVIMLSTEDGTVYLDSQEYAQLMRFVISIQAIGLFSFREGE